LSLGGQPREGLELAVLLGGVGVVVLDELGAQGEGEAVGRDQLGFQDVVEVEGLAARGLLGETVRAMTAPEEQLAGAVEGHQDPFVESPAVEGLHPDQAADDVDRQVLEGLGGHPLEVVDDRVVVGRRLTVGLGQRVEVGDEGLRVGLEAELPARAQPQQRDGDARPDQGLLRVDDPVGGPCIGQRREDCRQLRQEVPHRLGQHLA